MKRSIDIDLDVHRKIEAGRIAFGEDENAILRRLLGIDPRQKAAAAPLPRAPRSSGAYSVFLDDSPVEANSLKELLRLVILFGEKRQPGLIERLAGIPTKRGRHLVARTAAELYPRTPQLKEYGESLTAGWWYDTNVSRRQVQTYLSIIARELKNLIYPGNSEAL